MPAFEISITTKDDPRGVQSATEETKRLTDAMGKLLERSQKKEEYNAAKEEIAKMSAEEREAALAAYRLASAQEQTTKSISESGGAASRAGTLVSGLKSSWIELYGAIGVAQEVWQAAQTVWAETAGQFMELADSIRELQEAIGATSEEASTLIAIADDLQISADDIQRAFEAAIKKGFDPSIEGLIQLQQQFQAIQDPVQQTKFLMDTFGRTGADLRRLMELDADAMAEMAESAKATGQVFSQEQMQIAQDWREASDNIGDSWGRIKLWAGNTMLPIISDLTNATADYNNQLMDGQNLLLHLPVIGGAYTAYLAAQEGAARKAKDANDDYNASLDETANAIERVTNRGSYLNKNGYSPNTVNPGDEGYDPSHGYAVNPPGRASGGPVEAGKVYQVNENKPWSGPEYFVAPADGIIYPNAGSLGGGGGSQIINVYLTWSPMIGVADELDAQQKLVPLIKDALRSI